MKDKREQLKDYIDDLNSKLDSKYEVKLDSTRILINMYDKCYFEVRDHGLIFTHVHYDEDDDNPALLKLATMVSEYYFDLTDKWYEESAFRYYEMKKVNKFVEQINKDYAQHNISIYFSEDDNSYDVVRGHNIVANINKGGNLELFDEDTNPVLFFVFRLIECSGVFL